MQPSKEQSVPRILEDVAEDDEESSNHPEGVVGEKGGKAVSQSDLQQPKPGEAPLPQISKVPRLGRLSLLQKRLLEGSESSSPRKSLRHSVIILDSEILVKQEEEELAKFEVIHNQMLFDKKLRLDIKIGRKVPKSKEAGSSAQGLRSEVQEEPSARVSEGKLGVFDPLKAILKRHKQKIKKELDEYRQLSPGAVVWGRGGLSHRSGRHWRSQLDMSRDAMDKTSRTRDPSKEGSCSAISILNMAEKPEPSTSRPHGWSKASLDEGSVTSFRITGKGTKAKGFLDSNRTRLRQTSAFTHITAGRSSEPRKLSKRETLLQNALIVRGFD